MKCRKKIGEMSEPPSSMLDPLYQMQSGVEAIAMAAYRLGMSVDGAIQKYGRATFTNDIVSGLIHDIGLKTSTEVLVMNRQASEQCGLPQSLDIDDLMEEGGL